MSWLDWLYKICKFFKLLIIRIKLRRNLPGRRPSLALERLALLVVLGPIQPLHPCQFEEVGSDLDSIIFSGVVLLDNARVGRGDVDSDLISLNSCDDLVCFDEVSRVYTQVSSNAVTYSSRIP